MFLQHRMKAARIMPNKDQPLEKTMQQVQVTIAGRSYRMACEPGEHQHLKDLAALFDGRIEELRSNVGEIGDMRLHVMAALTIADELAESQRKIATLEKDLYDIYQLQQEERGKELSSTEILTESLLKAAERIEKLALYLNAPPE